MAIPAMYTAEAVLAYCAPLDVAEVRRLLKLGNHFKMVDHHLVEVWISVCETEASEVIATETLAAAKAAIIEARAANAEARSANSIARSAKTIALWSSIAAIVAAITAVIAAIN